MCTHPFLSFSLIFLQGEWVKEALTHLLSAAMHCAPTLAVFSYLHFSAGEWVKEALAQLGGKGGGKPTTAQVTRGRTRQGWQQHAMTAGLHTAVLGR